MTNDQFMRVSSSIMRDMLNALAADIDVHPRHLSIAYTYDDQTSAFGWRVMVDMERARVYAFGPGLVESIEQLAQGFKRMTVDADATADTEPVRVIH